jgi:predicted transcriptional regulator YheO
MKKTILNLSISTGKINTIHEDNNGGKIIDGDNLIKAEKTKRLYQLGVPVHVICNDLKISRTTLYRYLKNEKLQFGSYRNRKKK